jgi:hypothetical protein
MFADALEQKLDDCNIPDEYGFTPYSFEPATMAKLREIQIAAERIAKLMREVEWLYSADTSDDSFMRRVRAIEHE